MRVKKRIEPLPFGVYFAIALTICLVGLIDAVYLSISHYRVYTDIDYRSFCALSKAINCDTVSQSPYSIFLNVPVPFWGVLGYLLVLLLVCNAWRFRHAPHQLIWPSIFVITLAYSLNSVVLAVISSSVIHSHCIMCILSHAVNFSLLFCAWLIHRRFENTSIVAGLKRDGRFYRTNWKTWTTGSAVAVLLAVMLTQFFPPYWQMHLEPIDIQMKSGETADGYPWIGADHPEIVITEFSDYQCFQCKKMHLFLRQLVAEHRDRLRLVHRHFPMDHMYNQLVTEPYHRGSGKMALIALFAQQKGQFWTVNDLLFDLGAQKEDFNTKTIAERMNVTPHELAVALNDPYLRLRLKHDIAVGIDKGITGTPGLIIGDQVYTGTIPVDILQNLMAENEK